MELESLIAQAPIVREIAAARPCSWFNPFLASKNAAFQNSSLTINDVLDAEARLTRFAPFVMRAFPETIPAGGLIESPLTRLEHMQSRLCSHYNTSISGKLYLKRDSDLPIAGSVKARGGIYEVLRHTETLALQNGLISQKDDYAVLADHHDFFSRYKIQVGSTGNLGLSIGIASAAIGYQVFVHMSADAKQWKKELLREKGVTVVEYASDYSEAVKQGRAQSAADPMSYFVDDENSVDLFLGYAVAALRLDAQLKREGICVDEEHPLFVYIPCGVGGAPGGICFGLKLLYGDAVHVFFTEPVQAPCMLLGLISGLGGGICVQDVGLSGQTHADGLAVGRPSNFVARTVKPMLSGEFTLFDNTLYDMLRLLLAAEDIFIEPSACAALIGPVMLSKATSAREYIQAQHLEGHMCNATHIAWATGGKLVPSAIREEYKNTYLAKEI